MAKSVNIDLSESDMNFINEYDIDINNLFKNALNNKISAIKRNNPEPELSEDILKEIQNFHKYVKENDNLAAFHEGLPYNGISIGAISKKDYYTLEVKIYDVEIIPDVNISNTLEDSGQFLKQIKKQILNSIMDVDKTITELEFNLREHKIADNKFESDKVVFEAEIKT